MGELLPVTITLTNHSNKTIYYAEPSTETSCRGGWIVAQGDKAPLYHLPRLASPSCPAPLLRPLSVAQRLTDHVYVPLVASAKMTLTAQAYLFQSASWTGAPLFKAGLPTLPVRVMQHTPVGRALHLDCVRHRLSVTVDRGRLPAVLMMQQIDDYLTQTSQTIGTWQPVVGHILTFPQSNTRWTVLVGAPGYRIASRVYDMKGATSPC